MSPSPLLALVTPVPQTYPNLSCLQVFAVALLLGNALPFVPSCLFFAWLILSQPLSLSIDTLSLGSLPDPSQLGYLPLTGTPVGLEPLRGVLFTLYSSGSQPATIFTLPLSQWTFGNVQETFIVGTTGEEGACYWRLVERAREAAKLLQRTEQCSTAQN